MHYKMAKTVLDIDTVDKFIKEIVMEPEKMSKLKIARKDLPEEPKLIVLEIQ